MGGVKVGQDRSGRSMRGCIGEGLAVTEDRGGLHRNEQILKQHLRRLRFGCERSSRPRERQQRRRRHTVRSTTPRL
jgi:hypothetical protein